MALTRVLCLNEFKDLIYSPRNNTLVFLRGLLRHLRAHSVGLTTASLPISKDADIISVKEALYQVLDFIVDLTLSAILVEDAIKVESLRARCYSPYLAHFVGRSVNRNLRRVNGLESLLQRLKLFGTARVSFKVLTQDGPYSHEDPDVALVLEILIEKALL